MADKTFEHMNLSVLSEILLFGSIPEGQADSMSCEERLKIAESDAQSQLNGLDLEAQKNRETSYKKSIGICKKVEIIFPSPRM